MSTLIFVNFNLNSSISFFLLFSLVFSFLLTYDFHFLQKNIGHPIRSDAHFYLFFAVFSILNLGFKNIGDNSCV